MSSINMFRALMAVRLTNPARTRRLSTRVSFQRMARRMKIHLDGFHDRTWKRVLSSVEGRSPENHRDNQEQTDTPEILRMERVVDGPATRFGIGQVANLAESSVVGTAGPTVVLVAVTSGSGDDHRRGPPERQQADAGDLHELSNAIRIEASAKNSWKPFTVTFQERHHGLGRIPSQNSRRRDTHGPPSESEILASRAIDRALRPLLVPLGDKEEEESVHVVCSVQSHNVFGRAGNPVALALNTASVALRERLEQPVAAVSLCLDTNGHTVHLDPAPHQLKEESVAVELLYAGTRDRVVMMELGSNQEGVPEPVLENLIKIAHKAIQPILDVQDELSREEQPDSSAEPSNDELRASLGLPSATSINDEKSETVAQKSPLTLENVESLASLLLIEATQFCQTKLGTIPQKLFGYKDGMKASLVDTASSSSDSEQDDEEDLDDDEQDQDAMIHSSSRPLLSKSVRGRRENILLSEIQHLLEHQFEPSDPKLKELYRSIAEGANGGRSACFAMANAIHRQIQQDALWTTSTKYGTRGDTRGEENGQGCQTVRPLSVTVPALPPAVHGSALFSRGETQVLCTVTMGAPSDGVPVSNPYQETTDPRSLGNSTDQGPYGHLPVGSLRYLRSQEALVSDLNSRKVKAERELTGSSGTLDEVRRFFLHYDFPSFSTGELPSGPNTRREVGHGKLAEKALVGSLPPAAEFPYSIRVTSEVTGSNGSSSMATVCGATLAMLDAGIPLSAPVAGVSVGLALPVDNDGNSNADLKDYNLLLDITGTEDHYGFMDFKIAGTDDGVTALQLDVKRPLSMDIVFDALQLAQKGRSAILKEMELLSRRCSAGIISDLLPRPSLKDSAPRVEMVRFDPLRKRDLIGPGGAVLRQLEDRFGVSLDLTQEGRCLLFGADRAMVSKAKSAVMDLVADVVEGEVYEGTVIEIKDFGAIVELLRNKEGLLHVSELTDEPMSHPEGNHGIVHQHLRVGQKLEVLCTGVDPVQGSIRLSRKALLRKQKEMLQRMESDSDGNNDKKQSVEQQSS